MDLTQEIILQHGRHSPYRGSLKEPTHSARVDNPLCGDVIKIDIKITKNQVIEIAFSGEGCLISQASASLLVGETKKVKDLSKIIKFDSETVIGLLGIKPTLSRMQCALLSLEAIEKALAGK